MKNATLIIVTSIKEGWGLIVTEANSQGTPAIVYNSDGLRDSVIKNVTGKVVERNPGAMAQAILNVTSNDAAYEKLRHAAWEHSKQFTNDNSYMDFKKIISGSY